MASSWTVRLPRCTTRASAAWLGAALLAMAAGPAAAETVAAAEPSEVFEEAIAVEVINIDVVVTDRKGRPVTGLSADDFQLQVDGRPVTLANFLAVVPSTTPEAVSAAGNAGAVPETAAAPGIERRPEVSHLVLFVDQQYLAPASRTRLLRQIPAFIDQQMAAGARIMTVTHDLSTVVAHPFTTDSEAVFSGLHSLAEHAASGVQRVREWRAFVNETQRIIASCAGNPPCLSCQSELEAAGAQFAAQASFQRQRSLAGLGDVVSALRAVPGRKSVVYLGDGFPEAPGAEAFYHLMDVCPDNPLPFQRAVRDQRGASAMAPLTAHANANRVTFYAIEAAGLQAPSASDVEWASAGARPSGIVDSIRTANSQGALYYVTNETGGKAVLAANDAERALETLGTDFSTYYSLGYRPDHPPAGAVHRVGIRTPRLSRHQVELRYRRTFVHKALEEEMGERTLGALLFGLEANPLGASARVETPTPTGDDRFLVPITIHIPRDRLLTLPAAAGAAHGRLTVIMAADDGARSGIRKQELAVVQAPASGDGGDGGDHRFGVEIALTAGQHVIGLGLWDRVAQQASFLRIVIDLEALPTDNRHPAPVDGAAATTEGSS